MPVSDSNQRISSAARHSFGGTPTVHTYWDDNRQSSIDILSCPNSPHAGITSFATLALSDHPIQSGRKQFPLRVEFVGACGSQFDEFAAILATAAFCIINSNWLCHPGAIFPEVVARHRPHSPMKHLLFVPPFLWDPPLKTLKLPDKTVAWLMAIPISDPEYQHAMDQGRDTLEAELERRNIDFYNLDRPSIC